MGDPLDLYGRGSRGTSLQMGWKAAVSFGIAALLILGAAGYRWMTTSTPVTQDRAIELFRAEVADRNAAETQEQSGRTERSGAGAKGPRVSGGRTAAANQGPVAAGRGPSSRREEPTAASANTRSSRGYEVERKAPPEGVYTWDTEGYERAGGTQRQMPEESQRIVTHTSYGWEDHHYYSNQKENWTRFVYTENGAGISYQRNKITFGPVTNDSVITMEPAMLVGPRFLKVGQTWEGAWSGKTSGRYTGKTFERVSMNIGGTEVEAWGVEIDIRLSGEQSGSVLSRVWIAPEHHMTVKQYFKQDVRASVGNYYAEWTMTLQNLEPRR